VVPPEMPPTIPELEPIVPTDGVELDHVPPAVGSVSVVVAPAHTVNVPAMGRGAGSITTVKARVMVPCSGQASSANVT